MKKKIFAFMWVVIIILAAGCRPKNNKVVEEKFPDNSPKILKYYKDSADQKKLIKEEGFYQNRKMRYSGEFKNNKRNGKWVYYYEDGKVWSEGYFRDGQNDSTRITYYENGKKRYEGKYTLGARCGIWKFYDEAGKFVKQVDYGKGTKVPE